MPRLRRPLLALLLSACVLWPCGLPADGFRGGKIFELGSEGKRLLFTMHAELLAPDSKTRTFVSRYVDDRGQEALTERAVFKELKLREYTINQEQLGESYELTVDQGKLHFSATRKGKTETAQVELPDNLVIGPSFVPFLREHWGQLQKQETIKARLAVLDRQDTYGFEFVKLRETEFAGKAAVVIRMSPTSTFVSAVVRPTYFTLSPDGSRILEIKGRMLPKLKVGSRWIDFDGEAVFTY
jgi:hypothetical protein